MKNREFDKLAYAAFEEAALERYDFSTCQRPDGSYYGTGGTCRKGSEVSGGVPEKEKKGGSSGGGGASSSSEVRALDKTAKEANKKADASDKAYQKAAAEARKIEAKAVPDMRASRANPGDKALADKFRVSNMEARNARDKAASLQKTAVKDDRAAKKADKAADKADKAFQSSQKIQAKTKKLSAEYEKLRGDTSPKATARRKKIMEDVNKNIAKQKDLQSTINKAGASSKGPDTSPAANQRRANAAARARD